MKAIILAGGRGKRLKPVTDYVPKPLIPLDNIPIIEWQIRYLKKFGIKDIIICTGYKTEQIENYLHVKNNLGVKIQFSKEKVPLGTGGAIKQASHFINEKSFIVVNGDIITNIDIKKLKQKLRRRQSAGRPVTVAPTGRNPGTFRISRRGAYGTCPSCLRC